MASRRSVRSDGEFGARPGGRRYLLAAALLAAVVAGAHVSVGWSTSREHYTHVLLRLAYLVPLILAAFGSGAAGGVVVAALITAFFSTQVMTARPGIPWENTNQAAFVAVYWLVGPLVGLLVDRQHRIEARRREDQIRLSRRALVDALRALESALQYRDAGTARHGEAVADLAGRLARSAGLPERRIELVELAARVHDLGKIGVRDDVLYKPEGLTLAERRRIQAHPDIAADILAAVSGAAEIAAIVRAHHELLDGSGYPRGLRGSEIPLEAQILTVADVFCALTEDRTYHDARTTQEALALLASWAPERISERLVKALRVVLGLGSPP